jgi:hypothetical protein
MMGYPASAHAANVVIEGRVAGVFPCFAIPYSPVATAERITTMIIEMSMRTEFIKKRIP